MLPEVEGCAVRVRELVVDWLVVGEADADLDLAPVAVPERVARTVALVEALAVCERELVVVRVEDTLAVAVRVGTVVQDDVPLVVDVFEGGAEAERLEDADTLRLACVETLAVEVPEVVLVPCALREAVVVAETLREGRAVSVA